MGPPGIMLPPHRFVKAVAAGLRRCRVPPDARLIVATSGGADSVALLRALASLGGGRAWRLGLAVGHVQHHLRPDDEAEADAAFVAALAERLGLPFLRADLGPPARGNREGWARRARYAALADMARGWDAPLVATAHHAEDQLETLLMRIVRGTSVAGLRGIARRRPLAADGGGPPITLVRPMLDTRRAQTRAFLAELEQPWREDATNDDLTRLRARLRHGVIPLLAEAHPTAAARAVSLADHARDVSALLRGAVDAAAERVAHESGVASLPRDDARRLPTVVLTGLLRRLLIAAGAPPDAATARHLAPLARAARDREGRERRFAFGGGVWVEVTSGVLSVKRAER